MPKGHIILLAVIVSASSAPAKDARNAGAARVIPMSSPARADVPPELHTRNPLRLAAAVTDTFQLAWYSFDDNGLPSTQGWTSVDLTTQPDSFFHVAGATELDGGNGGNLLPIEGAQSLWCGVVSSAIEPFCGWATLPGYGNVWQQDFVSKTLLCDSLRLCYRIRWDSEPGYDWTAVEYRDASWGWTSFPVNGGVGRYDGMGDRSEWFTLAVSSDSTRLRFRFESDGIWSDEDGLWPTDGAVILDSVAIECFNGGVMTSTYLNDFEGEAPGARVTDDGVWSASVPPGFGDLSTLYPGLTVLQEDPCVANATNLWAWFTDPAIEGYWCHTPDPRPDQGVVPRSFYDSENNRCLALNNEIWSPPIPYAGAGTDVILSFSVYRDLPLDNLQFYTWHVRSWINNCPGRWKTNNFVYYGGGKDWLRTRFPIGNHVDPGATHIQIAIGAVDMCPAWCIFGCSLEGCHSHAPLIDNVTVERINVTGPRFTVFHVSLLQDNFAEDGSLTGSARTDAAIDIMPSNNPSIRPGDSLVISVTDPSVGLATDAFSGTGPAVYAYVCVLPNGQPGKFGADIEAPETRPPVGVRFPIVDSLVQDGVTWYCLRMDSVVNSAGVPVADRYCLDLSDSVFTPGDTIRYILWAESTSGARNYWSRRLDGQGDDFVTGDLAEALSSPMEFTILPAGGWLRGGEILYVDDTDDRGGPAELFFDTAFDLLSLRDKIDRYDVLGPSSAVGNSLASRVKSVQNQIIDCYRVILWNTGNLASGLLGDGGQPNGGRSTEKSDDYALLFQFLDQHANNPGLYLSGDEIARLWSDLVVLGSASPATMQSTFMNFTLADDDHVAAGEPVTPLLDGVDPAFSGEQFFVYGGCPLVNDFDLLQASGLSSAVLQNNATGRVYMLGQATPNAQATTARVLLSGFSYHYIRDVAPGSGPFAARVVHLDDALTWLQTLVPAPTGIDPPPATAAFLGANHPNPFNPTTTITYGIRERGPVSLVVYNVAGQRIRTLVRAVQSPRAEGFRVTWDGRNDAGEAVSSGVFFYRLSAPGFTRTRKMVLLK